MERLRLREIFSKKNFAIFYTSIKIGLFTILISLILFFSSDLLIDFCQSIFSDKLSPEKLSKLIETFAATLFSIGALSIIFNTVQYSRFHKLVEERFNEVVARELPPAIENIKNFGLTDIYEDLDDKILKDRLMEVKDRRIKIIKIWMPYIETICHALIDAINNRGCKFHVMLLDVDSSEAIGARVKSLAEKQNITEQYIKDHIRLNEDRIIGLLEKIHPDKRDKLILKTFNSFVAVSMIGFGDTYWVGLYLRGRYATEGMILKFESSHKPSFREMDDHFKGEWEAARLNPKYVEKQKELGMPEDEIKKLGSTE